MNRKGPMRRAFSVIDESSAIYENNALRVSIPYSRTTSQKSLESKQGECLISHSPCLTEDRGACLNGLGQELASPEH